MVNHTHNNIENNLSITMNQNKFGKNDSKINQDTKCFFSKSEQSKFDVQNF